MLRYGNFFEVDRTEAPKHGGSGTVYMARDTRSSDKLVAIKVVSLASALSVTCFNRECKALARLRHPGIVALLDFGVQDAEGWMVLPWIPQTLSDVIGLGPSKSPLNPLEVVDKYIRPICEAVSYAHENNVGHRDIKPGNILIHLDGTPVVADFGVAKIVLPLTQTATVGLWTSHVYTPEDPGTPFQQDVYSLGLVFAELLFRIRMTSRDDAMTRIERSGLPSDLKALLVRCLEPLPQDRYASASELLQAVRDYRTAGRQRARANVCVAVTLTDHARTALEGLNDAAPSIERALADEFQDSELFLSAATEQDAAHGLDRSKFWVLTNRCRLLFARHHSLEGHFTIIAASVRSLEDLEHLRRSALAVQDLGLQWEVGRHDTARAVPGMRILLDIFEEWVDRGMPASRKNSFSDPDVTALTDKWQRVMDAREEASTGSRQPLQYIRVNQTATRIEFELADEPMNLLVGSFWSLPLRQSIVAEVVFQQATIIAVTTRFPGTPKLPARGELRPAPDGGSESALRRQREALEELTSGSAQRLGALLAAPEHAVDPNPAPPKDWVSTTIDEHKKQAVALALGNPEVTLVQGPPGTGKTAMIAELVAQFLIQRPTAQILLVSQTHVALDNALERLEEIGIEGLVRLGSQDDDRVSPKTQHLLVDRLMLQWGDQVATAANEFAAQVAQSRGLTVNQARALIPLFRLKELHRALDSIPVEVSLAESQAQAMTESLEIGDEAAALAAQRESLKLEIATATQHVAEMLRGELTISLASSGADIEHIIGAVVGTADIDADFRRLVEAQASWSARIKTSAQMAPLFLTTRRVLAGTCLGFLGNRAVRDLRFDLCIIDEASRATTTESLVPMVRSDRWVLVGDSHQLSAADFELENNRAVLQQHNVQPADIRETMFARIEERLPASCQARLSIQYRMANPIGNLISECFYRDTGGLISSGPAAISGLNLLLPPVLWLDTSSASERDRSESAIRAATNVVSFQNRGEARQVTASLQALDDAVARGLVRPISKLNVLVIAPYVAQVEFLRRELARLRLNHLEVAARSIDSVQGQEADVVYFSATRSNSNGQFGFMSSDYWQRANVALSRARHSVVIVGDANYWRASGSSLKVVLEYVEGQQDLEIREVAHA